MSLSALGRSVPCDLQFICICRLLSVWKTIPECLEAEQCCRANTEVYQLMLAPRPEVSGLVHEYCRMVFHGTSRQHTQSTLVQGSRMADVASILTSQIAVLPQLRSWQSVCWRPPISLLRPPVLQLAYACEVKRKPSNPCQRTQPLITRGFPTSRSRDVQPELRVYHPVMSVGALQPLYCRPGVSNPTSRCVPVTRGTDQNSQSSCNVPRVVAPLQVSMMIVQPWVQLSTMKVYNNNLHF